MSGPFTHIKSHCVGLLYMIVANLRIKCILQLFNNIQWQFFRQLLQMIKHNQYLKFGQVSSKYFKLCSMMGGSLALWTCLYISLKFLRDLWDAIVWLFVQLWLSCVMSRNARLGCSLLGEMPLSHNSTTLMYTRS
jgi:hypothetical protein